MFVKMYVNRVNVRATLAFRPLTGLSALPSSSDPKVVACHKATHCLTQRHLLKVALFQQISAQTGTS